MSSIRRTSKLESSDSREKKKSIRKLHTINGVYTALMPPQPSICSETICLNTAQELSSLFVRAVLICISISRVEDAALRCSASAVNRNTKINKTSHGQNNTGHNGTWPM